MMHPVFLQTERKRKPRSQESRWTALERDRGPLERQVSLGGEVVRGLGGHEQPQVGGGKKRPLRTWTGPGSVADPGLIEPAGWTKIYLIEGSLLLNLIKIL